MEIKHNIFPTCYNQLQAKKTIGSIPFNLKLASICPTMSAY